MEIKKRIVLLTMLLSILSIVPAYAGELEGMGEAIIVLFMCFIGIPILLMILLRIFRRDRLFVNFTVTNFLIFVFILFYLSADLASDRFRDFSSVFVYVQLFTQLVMIFIAMARYHPTATDPVSTEEHETE